MGILMVSVKMREMICEKERKGFKVYYGQRIARAVVFSKSWGNRLVMRSPQLVYDSLRTRCLLPESIPSKEEGTIEEMTSVIMANARSSSS